MVIVACAARHSGSTNLIHVHRSGKMTFSRVVPDGKPMSNFDELLWLTNAVSKRPVPTGPVPAKPARTFGGQLMAQSSRAAER